ncbi:MAG: hypothetical protein Q4G46_13115, partial [Propionibacteriaceae bacterium]|nr:hypothetical protein [Propionibacteriaceae bacterium]
RSASCPVAIIERGWAPDQRVTVAALDQIADEAERRDVESPAVIVVGDVVRLGPDWAAREPSANLGVGGRVVAA